jgi:hypothetical protein
VITQIDCSPKQRFRATADGSAPGAEVETVVGEDLPSANEVPTKTRNSSPQSMITSSPRKIERERS